MTTFAGTRPRHIALASEEVYVLLRAVSHRAMSRERGCPMLQTTALAHEAFIKLREQRSPVSDNPVSLRAVASIIVRRILVDDARRRQVSNRSLRILRDTRTGNEESNDMLALEDALVRLAQQDARKALVVQYKFFGAMNTEQAAAALDVSPRTVEQDWRCAKAWLHREMGHASG